MPGSSHRKRSPGSSSEQSRFDERKYQNHILKRIKQNRNRNILIELDCGLGKRVLTYKLVTELFPNTRFVITVNSSSSLQETAQYLEVEYGGVHGLGVLSPKVQGRRRIDLLKTARVVVCTPRVLANILKKGELTSDEFEALVINEVDTIIRRMGPSTILIQPWNYLLDFFKDHWLLGLSGTLRDDHVVFDEEQLQIREELKTIATFIPNAELISMEELADTDLETFIKPTIIDVEPVQDPVIRVFATILDELIQSTREEIYQIVREESGEEVRTFPESTRLLHLMLEELPISEELGQRYSGLLMIRKYLYGMSAKSFRRYLHHPVLKTQIDASRMMQDWPKTTPKSIGVKNLTMKAKKTVILSSYLNVVSEINSILQKAGISTFQITGKTQDKQLVLSQFKSQPVPAVLILSPVGERDLDLPDAELLIIYDTVNTTKTIYQKMKRSRGGRVVFMVYDDTSEVMKLHRLISNIMQRYPWSTKLGDITPLSGKQINLS